MLRGARRPRAPAEQFGRTCADRCPNRQLARSLIDALGDDAVHTDRGKEQRDRSEHGDPRAHDALSLQIVVDEVGGRLVVQAEVRFHRREQLANAGAAAPERLRYIIDGDSRRRVTSGMYSTGEAPDRSVEW